ncbi:MAG TPA: hypothetical protein VFG41_05290 [Sphingomicrobium sp.]|jgi:hypothetical protein|nr:hypothetical protein [Sphingomicrobium sp.]
MATNKAGRGKKVAFLLNLMQDVNIVRGLVYLTARETDAKIILLVSQGFLKRDRVKSWQAEIASLAADIGASICLYGSTAEACAVLEDGEGIIFAASESSLSAHWETSEVFAAAPPAYLKVTLQHGLEGVGFLQSREHVMSHGRNVSFHADVVCGWLNAPALTSLVASERAKLYVTGPPTLLQQPGRDPAERQDGGLVCENMHSVRLRASGDHKTSFMDIFFAFARSVAERGESVVLRPHPGGQYVLKNNIELPGNVGLNNRPIFDVNLTAYRFGISAPSTIVLDMVLAGIPVGVWRDSSGIMDASAYNGLTEISTLDDWLAFERDVRLRPEMILERQHQFVRQLQMPTDPAEIYRRFTRLIVAGLAGLPNRAGRNGSAPAAPPEATLSGDVLAEVA